MLKDKFKKFFNTDSKNQDPIRNFLMEGFVDIKGYKTINGEKKLVYHDCGDNVVTDWMRHAMMVMLTGSVFSSQGQDSITGTISSSASRNDSTSFSKINETQEYHAAINSNGIEGEGGKNFDGYLLNGQQYFFDSSKITKKYSESSIPGDTNKYALFPTKVLFGTGKEYSSWNTLQTENETANATWYTEMLNSFGGDLATASAAFNDNIDLGCNTYSGSISKNIYTGNGMVIKSRTVNDPDNSSNVISTTSTMNKNYGVVGAIKTPYFDGINDLSLLNTTISDSGRLLKPVNRGIGRPCFIYFNTPQSNGQPKEAWDNPQSSEVALSKDASSSYLNKITFSITLPSQSSADGAIGQFYPYNGYTLKQIGLFNDARLTTGVTNSADGNSYPYLNMPCGMLLAIKNITAFEKTADVELKLTWTLTI